MILTFALQQHGLAQSWTIQNSTVTDDLHDIARNFSGDLFAVGSNSKILRSTDGGTTWTAVTSPITADFRRISFSTGFTYGYILTSQGAILRTLDNGDTWSLVTVPTEISGNIVDIEAKGGELFVLLGNSGKIYRSTSAGGNLTFYHNPSNPSVSYMGSDLEIRGSRVNFATTSRYHREVSTGVFESKVLTRSGTVTNVTSISGNFFVGVDGRIERTDDGGANWINLSSPVSTNLYDVAASGTTVFVVGAEGKIYKSINNGASWQNSGSGTTNKLNAILVDTDINNAWVVGAGGTILKTINGGTCLTPLQPSVIVGPTSINTGVQGNYAVSNVAGVTYNWFPGTGGVVTGSGNAVEIAWSSAGTKNITVTATTACGTSIGRVLTVTASTCALPAQPTLSQGSAVGCQFQSSTFSVNSVAGVSYTWSLSGGGVITGNGNSAVVTWSNAGNFTVSATPSNACGNGIARTINVTVTGTPASPSAISGNTIVCTGVSTAYSVTNVAGLTYTWDTGGAGTVSGSGNAVNVTWTTGGVKTLTLSATNTCGSVTTRTQAITVNLYPSQPSVIAGSIAVTTGISNQYSVTSEAGVTYAWNAGTGGTVTGSGNSVNISWSSAGSKTITLTPSNGCGNGTTRTLNVNVSDCAVPAQPSTITGSATACTTGSGTYSVINVGGVTYNWNAGTDGFVSGSGNSVTLSWTSIGVKTITVTPSNACGNGTARTLVVTVSQLPAQPSVIAGSITPCKNNSIGYSVSNVAGVTYTWDVIGTGTITGSGNSINVNWSATGSHILRVTPSNSCGAGVARTIEVIVNDVPLAASQMAGLTSVCAGNSIPYSVGNVAGVTYTWNGGSGSTVTGSGSAVSIAWSTGGTKTISVTPSNACGNGATSTKNVEVSTTPAQPSTIVGSTAAVGGIAQSYSVTNIPGVTYTWTTDIDGVVASSGNTAQVTWATAGAKTLTVTPNNFCGIGTARTLSVSTTVPCTIPGTPSSITLDANVSTNTNINLNGFRRFIVGSSAGATSLNISVSPSAGTTITPVFGNTWDIVFTIPGTYTVSGYGEISGCGAGAPATISVIVCTGTVADPTAISGPLTQVCRGTTTRYSVTPVTGVLFDWSLSGFSGTITPLNADRSIVDVAWSSTGSLADVLTVRAKNACNVQSNSYSEQISFTGKPQAGGISLTSNGMGFCVGLGGLIWTIGLPEAGTIYTWELNGAGTIAPDNLSVTIPADGVSRTVRLLGSNTCFVNEFISDVNYNGGTPIPVTPSPVSGPSTINFNTNGTYSVDVPPSTDNLFWDAGSDATITAGASSNIKNIQWSTGGIKTIYVSASNSCGSPPGRSFTVFVNGPCVAPSVPGTISGESTVCAGVEYQYAVPFQNFDTFNWSAGADATITGSGSIRTIKWSTGGAKTISVTATNLCTTSAAQTLNVTVNTIPTQPATLTGSAAGCSGAAQQISLASPIAGVTYTWEVQGGNVVTSGAQGQFADITWTALGVNEVKLKPSNACGNGTASTLNVTIGTIPVQPSIITGESEVCTATSKAYNVTNTPGVTYAWNAGSGGTVTGTGNAVSISWSTTGAKTIILTPSNTCGNGTTRTLVVNVIGVPAQPASITGVANPTLGNQEVYGVSPVAGVNYTWSLSDKGIATTSGNNASVFWNIPGNATLSVTPSNTCGNGVVRNASITVNKISQTISFTLASPVLADQVISLEATSTSGLPVTYVSSNTSVVEVLNNELIIKASGAVNITASQAGDETFAAATNVIRALTINKANQVIIFEALPAISYGDEAIELTAETDSGLPLIYSSSNTSVATISGNVLTLVGAGTANITATQGGNAIFNAATPVVRALVVNKADQSISFDPLSAKGINDPPFTLTATASSELTVTYSSSNTSVATISGSTVTLVGEGTTIITATQTGNVNYNAAAPVEQTLEVNGKEGQTISFAALSAKTFGDANFELNATASSNLVVSYVSSNTAVATVSGTTVTIVGAGSTTITASQSGNEIFNPASSVQQTLTVNKAEQTISFTSLDDQLLSTGSLTLNATATSGLAISYESSNTSVATVLGATLTFHSAGTTTITASQAGNDNFNAAQMVDQLLIITAKQLQSISFAVLPSKTFGDAAFDLTASASSNLPVQFVSSNTTVATVSGNLVTIVGAGSAMITATQSGNDSFEAAVNVSQELVVAKANQIITFSLLASVNFTTNTLSLQATSSAGLAIDFASSNTSIATVNGNTLTFVIPGAVEVTASQEGNTNYNAANQVIVPMTIVDDRQTIALSGSLDFGNVLLGETTTKTITIANTGNAALQISTITLPQGFSSSVGATTINANASISAQITFAPTELKDYTGSVVISSDAVSGNNSLVVNGTGVTITGFNEPGQTAGDLDVYPNPGNGIFMVKSRMPMNKTIAITDMSGKAQYRILKSIDEQHHELDIVDLPQGIYYLQVEEKGSVAVKRIVKLN